MFLKYAYVIFIGVLLATFIGVGIAAFYKGPKSPDYPASLKFPQPAQIGIEATISAQQRKEQEMFDGEQKAFQSKYEEYNKIVSIIALSAAVLILVLSLTILKTLPVIADGAILGGVLTLIYSIVRGFNANDDIFRFFVVSIGLIVALSLGYLKYIKVLTKRP
jgi:hypothetical protein